MGRFSYKTDLAAFYIDKFTITEPCTFVPSDTSHSMVNVVAAVMGTVAAPPERDF